MKVKVGYDSPIAAPIRSGQELATLTISTPDTEIVRIPLVAGKDIPRLGMFERLGAAIGHLIWGAAG